MNERHAYVQAIFATPSVRSACIVNCSLHMSHEDFVLVGGKYMQW